MNDPPAAARHALANGNPTEALRIAKAHAVARPADPKAARLYAVILRGPPIISVRRYSARRGIHSFARASGWRSMN